MKIKRLTQTGKYTLLAGVFGMMSIPSFAIPTDPVDLLPAITQQTTKIKGKFLMPIMENLLSEPMYW